MCPAITFIDVVQRRSCSSDTSRLLVIPAMRLYASRSALRFRLHGLPTGLRPHSRLPSRPSFVSLHGSSGRLDADARTALSLNDNRHRSSSKAVHEGAYKEPTFPVGDLTTEQRRRFAGHLVVRLESIPKSDYESGTHVSDFPLFAIEEDIREFFRGKQVHSVRTRSR